MIKSVENITYNGVDLAAEFTGPNNAYFVVNYVRGRGVMPEALELVSVPGMAGSYLTDSGTPERIIEVDITMKGESFTDLRRRIEKLDSVLRSGNGAAVPIQFDDEPDRIYFGTLEDVSHRVEVSHIYQATITLICPDPHKYGTEQSAPSDEPGSGRNYARDTAKQLELYGTGAINGNTGSPNNSNFGRDPYPLSISPIANMGIKAGDTIIFSYDWTAEGDEVSGSFKVGFNAAPWELSTPVNLTESNTSGRVEYSLKVPAGHPIITSTATAIRFRTDYIPKGTTVYVSNFKFEKGTTATPWSPAPEDTGVIELNNEGSADTYPIVEVKLKKPTPFLSISNGHEINMIGEIPGAEEPVYEKYENILVDNLRTTVGWAKVNFKPYTGAITDGSIVATTEGFVPSDYGYQNGMEWHGPALAKSLPQQLQDFMLHLSAYQRATDQSAVGRVELYALDNVNKPVASVHFIKDTYGKITRPEVWIYNANGTPKKIMSYKRDQVPDWKDLTGYISIIRDGQKIIAQAERSRGQFGMAYDRRVELYQDTDNLYQRPIVSVAVVFQAYRQTATLNRNRAMLVQVRKINQQEGIPYIGGKGDTIIFDHPENVIYKNGIDVKKEKAFIGQYFALKPGENALAIEPIDAIESMTARWRDRWR